MNKRMTALLILCTAGVLYAATAEQLARLAEGFATDDAFSLRIAFGNFEKEFPPAERALTLHQLWQSSRERPDVELNIMDYLRRAVPRRALWDGALKADTLEAAKSPNLQMRTLALFTLADHDERDAIKPFLIDSDEELRQQALIVTRSWPDHKTILQHYIATNSRVPERKASVAKAQFLLENVQ